MKIAIRLSNQGIDLATNVNDFGGLYDVEGNGRALEVHGEVVYVALV